MARFKGKHRRRGCGIVVLPLAGILGAFVVFIGTVALRVLG